MTEITTLTPGARVTGWIKFYNAAKGYGIVTVQLAGAYERVEVFIRKEKGLSVTGTHDAPVLGDQHDYSTYRFRRNDTEIVMEVEPSNRGWRASQWGVLPEFTWVDLFLKYQHLLQRFIGGLVELDNRSDYGIGGYNARIDSLVMTREHITLHARHYPRDWQHGQSTPDESKLGRAFTKTYPLGHHIQQADRNNSLELVWREDEGNSYNRLTFWEPSR
ncbi:MAG TPA: hypothetical protein VLG40_05150 [Candidatus Saccharimonas sp.]|nr:hypothetical protein [Candidatus Saccharimonas sp.]